MRESEQITKNDIILNICDLSAGYDGEYIIKNINADIKRGEIVSILGANGSGKSTLLKALVNSINRKGSIRFYGIDISKYPEHKIIRTGISILHQYNNVLSDLTVSNNLEINKTAIKNKDLYQIFDDFNIASDGLFSEILEPKVKNKRAGLLSGGEKQKLALLMTLSAKSDIYLLDEPTASLSSSAVFNVMKLIKHISINSSKTFIIVEQNIKSAISITDRVLIMKNGFLNAIEDTGSLLFEDKLEEIFLK